MLSNNIKYIQVLLHSCPPIPLFPGYYCTWIHLIHSSIASQLSSYSIVSWLSLYMDTFNTFKYCYTVVFLFHCFLVITVHGYIFFFNFLLCLGEWRPVLPTKQNHANQGLCSTSLDRIHRIHRYSKLGIRSVHRYS